MLTKLCCTEFKASASTHHCGSCGYIACDNCQTSGQLHHPHPTVPMILSYRTLDPNFWQDLLKGEHDWTCDKCSRTFYSKLQRYTLCASCKNHGFCDACINDCKIAPLIWRSRLACSRICGIVLTRRRIGMSSE